MMTSSRVERYVPSRWFSEGPGGLSERGWLTIVLVLVVLGVGGCGSGSSTGDSVGDVSMTARGPLAYYPRYTIEFEPVGIGGQVSQSYRLSSLPKAEYTFYFQVLVNGEPVETGESWEVVWQALEHASSQAVVRIKDDSGNVLASGGGVLVGSWYPAAWGEARLLSHPTLADLDLVAGALVLEIAIEGRGRPAGEVSVKPVLIGGGIRKF